MSTESFAPGWPGIPPRWTSSAKTGVGTALNQTSRVWFTLSHGIFDEIYYPRVDQACTRDMGMIVTSGTDFFSEEKRQTEQKVETLAPGVPAYKLTNTCIEGRYRIKKEILADPKRDVVLQSTKFTPLQGKLSDYHLYVELAPHLRNEGANNTAWVGDYKGVPMLFAERPGVALALACSAPWLNRSAGFVGASDGWRDLNQHKQMTWNYTRAEDGNVALTGEIDLAQSGGNFVLALGFGANASEAGQRARASLLDGFKGAHKVYLQEWQDWLKTLLPLSSPPNNAKETHDLFLTSAAVMRTHESKRFPGALIASLSIPWGFSMGDDDLGGYHLSWPRDLVESAGGLLAIGAHNDARRVLYYLQVTQEADGHWPQNMWLDGSPYWNGIQMDETAFPILLADLANREKALKPDDLKRLWPMVKGAAGFLAKNGPVTTQDRWEEDPGYSPFTLAVEIAALLAAADLADLNGEAPIGVYLRETADTWNSSIERWVYATGTDLAGQIGVDGYYVRISPPDVADVASPSQGFVPIKNRPPGDSLEPAAHIISPDALALVRFGLRAADDPRIVNTVKVIDAVKLGDKGVQLKTDLPYGPGWHRYNYDGYGEHSDGSPFDGTGIGRVWPLLAGERAHYELAAGHTDEATNLLHVFEAGAGVGNMLPEQTWDAADIIEDELFFGKPSGSAMPLVWAHAEYVKLLRSLRDGHVFDMPPQTVQRYIVAKTESNRVNWRFDEKRLNMPAGKMLRIELLAMATAHWSVDNWQTVNDMQTREIGGLGIYLVDLPVDTQPANTTLVFTFHWSASDTWEGTNFSVNIV
jgi:glucoamylase